MGVFLLACYACVCQSVMAVILSRNPHATHFHVMMMRQGRDEKDDGIGRTSISWISPSKGARSPGSAKIQEQSLQVSAPPCRRILQRPVVHDSLDEWMIERTVRWTGTEKHALTSSESPGALRNGDGNGDGAGKCWSSLPHGGGADTVGERGDRDDAAGSSVSRLLASNSLLSF